MPERKDYRLRDMRETDLAKVLEWRNSDRVRANMFSDHIISVNEHHEWFRKLQQDRTMACKVFELSGRPVGVINVSRIDMSDGTCSWGLYLGEENLPRGSGTAMGYLALEFIFEDLRVSKVLAEVFRFNEASVALHERLGFVREESHARHVLKNGTDEEVIVMALAREVWVDLRDKVAAACFGTGDR